MRLETQPKAREPVELERQRTETRLSRRRHAEQRYAERRHAERRPTRRVGKERHGTKKDGWSQKSGKTDGGSRSRVNIAESGIGQQRPWFRKQSTWQMATDERDGDNRRTKTKVGLDALHAEREGWVGRIARIAHRTTGWVGRIARITREKAWQACGRRIRT